MNSDTMHQPGADKEWNESFYFNFYDQAHDLCMFMRIGLKPNMDERSMFCFIMMPDGSVIGKKEMEVLGDGSLNVSSLRFHMLEPEKRWKLEFNGAMARMEDKGPVPVKVKFSLEFESLTCLDSPLYFSTVGQTGSVSLFIEPPRVGASSGDAGQIQMTYANKVVRHRKELRR